MFVAILNFSSGLEFEHNTQSLNFISVDATNLKDFPNKTVEFQVNKYKIAKEFEAYFQATYKN